DFNFGAAVFGDEHLVTDFHVADDFVSVVILAAGAESEHFGFLRFFLGGVGQDDAARGDGFGFETFDEDTLSEWFDVGHMWCCTWFVCWRTHAAGAEWKVFSIRVSGKRDRGRKAIR